MKIDEIMNLEELYKKFYSAYANVVELLKDIFDSLDMKEGSINENTEAKLTKFTEEKTVL